MYSMLDQETLLCTALIQFQLASLLHRSQASQVHQLHLSMETMSRLYGHHLQTEVQQLQAT